MIFPAAGLLPGIRLQIPKVATNYPPEHDEHDGDVAHYAAHHAEDVHTQVQSQLRHRGPGVCHRLGRVIAH